MINPEIISAFDRANRICTDTRDLSPGDIFFALKGPNFNANEFAKAAIASGAIAAIVDEKDKIPANDERFILVDDVLEALQELAKNYRKRFDIPVIGITGSNGKTTTKELVDCVLASERKVHSTKGNLNNHIGVPMTLCRMPEATQIAVIEMGANKPGDIMELCRIADPNHGLITNIGHAHLERFGDIRGVELAKGELFNYLSQVDGMAWINVGDDLVRRHADSMKNFVTYGRPGSDYFVSREELAADHILLEVDGMKMGAPIKLKSKLIGSHNAENILAAVVSGMEMGIEPGKIAEAIAAYEPKMNRTQLVRAMDYTILLDAYNSNPSSVKAAIESVFALDYGKVALVLGDMFELGEGSEDLHRELGGLVSKTGTSKIVGIGNNMKFALEECRNIPQSWFPDAKSAGNAIQNELKGMDFVLIKGSRGMALEQLMEKIEAK